MFPDIHPDGFDPELLPLNFSDGWEDLLTASDRFAQNYRLWMNEFADKTQQRLQAGWTQDRNEVFRRWQQLIEWTVYLSVPDDYFEVMDTSELLETAILTIVGIIDQHGWYESGVSFTIPMSQARKEFFGTEDDVVLDIRDME